MAGLALLGSALALALFDGFEPGQAQQPEQPAVIDGFEIGVDGKQLSSADVMNATHRLRIPRIGVDAPIVSVEADKDDVIGVPRDPAVVGWWRDGPVPGHERGTSILVGHANSAAYGPGALIDLESLRPGDILYVAGWWERDREFLVEKIEEYPKSELPASEAFAQDVPGRLAIVSCSDLDEETGQYRDNIIAYAVATGGSDLNAEDDRVATEEAAP